MAVSFHPQAQLTGVDLNPLLPPHDAARSLPADVHRPGHFPLDCGGGGFVDGPLGGGGAVGPALVDVLQSVPAPGFWP
jgi:hypothetical protein